MRRKLEIYVYNIKWDIGLAENAIIEHAVRNALPSGQNVEIMVPEDKSDKDNEEIRTLISIELLTKVRGMHLPYPVTYSLIDFSYRLKEEFVNV